MPVYSDVSMNFDEVLMLINRASGRAAVGIGVAAAVETKRVTHVVSGNLRRSVHAAPAGYDDAEADQKLSASADLMLALGPPAWLQTPLGPAVEVGSWLPYACVEWIGRAHPGITQGLEAVRGTRADMIVRQAFAEEGLL